MRDISITAHNGHRTACALARFVLLLATAIPAIAGICTNDPFPGDLRHEFQFFAGYSLDSATLIGTTPGVQFIAAGFEYSYRCWAWNGVSISFTPGIIPVAVQKVPPLIAYNPLTGAQRQLAAAHWVYGFGITPVGFTFDFGRKHAVYPFFELNGGIITSTDPIPVNVPDATAFNFLFDFGGGLKWQLHDRRYGFEGGYKFLHISNAFRTSVNPGIDNNVFYLGFSLYR